MDYNEFVKNHKNMIGRTVWICDYRFLDISKKPIRHVKPTEVLVVSNDELPSNKTVYYSDIHFKPIGNKGIPLKQIIAPFDNTGYRSFTGTSLNIFITKKECVECYLEQCELVKKEIEIEREKVNKRLDKIEIRIEEMIGEFISES